MPKVIKFGTPVLYYNRWTNYDNRDVLQQFHQASQADIKKLRAGDTIWMSVDPLHPNGKVYGFVKTKVTKVEGNKICHAGGFTTVHRMIFFVDDESVLAELIAADPKMTDVIGDSGRMASSLIDEFGPREALNAVRLLACYSGES